MILVLIKQYHGSGICGITTGMGLKYTVVPR